MHLQLISRLKYVTSLYITLHAARRAVNQILDHSPQDTLVDESISVLTNTYNAIKPQDRWRLLKLLSSAQATTVSRLVEHAVKSTRGQWLTIQLYEEAQHPNASGLKLEYLRDTLREGIRRVIGERRLYVKAFSWDEPARLLDAILKCDAVQPVEWLDELRRRLALDRRQYCLVHPSFPSQPLAIAQVALVSNQIESIFDLTGSDSPILPSLYEAKRAIFYSLSICRRGLGGVGFGRSLLEGTLSALRQDLPHLQTIETLSPAPGFVEWLRGHLTTPSTPSSSGGLWFDTDELTHILSVIDGILNGYQSPQALDTLRESVIRLSAIYLTHTCPRDRVIDPVAHFHLSNGALLREIKWMANPTKRGLEESAGIMVVYQYDPELMEKRRKRYASAVPIIPLSLTVQRSLSVGTQPSWLEQLRRERNGNGSLKADPISN